MNKIVKLSRLKGKKVYEIIDDLARSKINDHLDDILSLLSSSNAYVRESVINFLHRHEMKHTINQIKPMINDRSVLVRIAAVTAVAQMTKSNVDATCIFSALNDKNELVRITAIENVLKFITPANIINLEKLLNDSVGLVRFYVFTCLGELRIKSSLTILLDRLPYEKSPYAKLGLLIGLFNFGREEYYDNILSFTFHNNYKIRCATLNFLMDANLSPLQFEQASRKVNQLSQNEKTVAVKNKINYFYKVHKLENGSQIADM